MTWLNYAINLRKSIRCFFLIVQRNAPSRVRAITTSRLFSGVGASRPHLAHREGDASVMMLYKHCEPMMARYSVGDPE